MRSTEGYPQRFCSRCQGRRVPLTEQQFVRAMSRHEAGWPGPGLKASEQSCPGPELKLSGPEFGSVFCPEVFGARVLMTSWVSILRMGSCRRTKPRAGMSRHPHQNGLPRLQRLADGPTLRPGLCMKWEGRVFHGLNLSSLPGCRVRVLSGICLCYSPSR